MSLAVPTRHFGNFTFKKDSSSFPVEDRPKGPRRKLGALLEFTELAE